MFKKALKNKILILDGAMGSNIQKYKLEEKDMLVTLLKKVKELEGM